MAVSSHELRAVISLQDQFSRQMNAVVGSVTSLQSKVGALSAGVGGAGAGFLKLSGAMAVGNLAAGALVGTVGQVGGALASGISAATGFGQSMANIRSVLPAGEAAQFGAQLEDLSLKLGKDLPLSASEAASGLEALAKKGISARDILDGAGKSVAILASVTGEDLSAGAEVAAAAVNTFSLSGKQVVDVTNLMAGAVIRGGTTVTQFGQGLAQAGTTVNTFGGTIQDVTIALGVMAKAGVQGSDAGTSLKTMYQNLIPTTKTAIAAQQELGLVTANGSSAFIDATGKVKSYEEIARILAVATKDLSEAQRAQAFETIFGTDAVRAAGIAAQFGAGKFGDFANAIRSVDAEGIAKERLNSLAGDMKNLGGSVETLVISIGTKLEPVFRSMAQAANAGVGGLIEATRGLDFSGLVNPIREAFDAAGKWIAEGGSITGAIEILVGRLNAFGASLFGSGFTLISTFAQGMVSGVSAIFQAVSAVAEAIASFLVGSSPPPSGPLSQIDQDGRKLIETYAAGAGAASLGPIEDVAARVQGTLSDFKGLEGIGSEVEGQVRLIGDAIEDIGRKSQDVTFQIQDIKTGYEDQLDPLKAQLAAIDDVNDSLSKQKDITEEIAGLNLKQAEAAAKGDPSKRAEIAGQQEANRFAQDALQLKIRELELTNQKSKKPGGAGSNDAAIKSAKEQLLSLDRDELGIKKSLADLTDRGKLAEIAKAKAALDMSGDARKIEERKAALQRDLLKLPIEQQIKDITKAQHDQLAPLEAQQRALERQSAALTRQRQDWQGLAGDIKRAAEAVKPEKAAGGAGGAGAGGGIKLPGLPAGGAKIPSLSDTLLKSADEAAAKAKEAGEKMATNVMEGVQSFLASNGPKIIGGAFGALVGGVAFGPIGLLLGGSLGASIGEGIGKAVPDIGARAAELATSVQTAIAGGLPGIMALLGQWGAAFVGWVTPYIAPLLAEVGRLAGLLLNWLAAQVGPLTTQLLAWGQAFLGWIAPQIPPLLAELGRLSTALLGWLLSQVGPLAQQLLTWGLAFVNWIAPQLPGLLAELGKLAGGVWQWITDNAPALTRKLASWATEFVGWVAVASVALPPQLVKFLGTIATWIVEIGVPEVGKLAGKLAIAIIQGIADGLINFGSKIGPILKAEFIKALGFVDPKVLRALGIESGGAYIEGVQTSLDNGMPVLRAVGGAVGTAAIEGFEDATGIQSPSKEMYERGRLLAQGLANGIAAGDTEVARAIGIIVRAALENGIDPLVAVALAKAESGLHPRGPAGDQGHSVGLFQEHDQGQGAGLSVAQRQDPVGQSNRFLAAHAALFKQLVAEGLAGEQLAATFGRLAEVSDPQFAHRYADAYRELVATLGTTGAASAALVTSTGQLGVSQKMATDWAKVFAEQQAALTQTLEGQAPAGRKATDAMEAFSKVLGPIERQVAGGAISADTLRFKLLDLGRATGLAAKPWDDLASGQLDATAAMEELINQTADLSPAFKAVQAYMATAGSSSNEAALQWLQAALNYGKAQEATVAATTAAPAVAGNAVATVGNAWDTAKAAADLATTATTTYQSTVGSLDASKINEQTEAWAKATEAVTKFSDAAHQIGDYLDNHTFKFHAEFPDVPDDFKPGSPTPLELGLRGIGKALRDVNNIPSRSLRVPTVSRVPVTRPGMSRLNAAIVATHPAAGATGSRGGAGVTLNFHAGSIVANDPKDAARQIRDEMIKHGRRNGGRVLE